MQRRFKAAALIYFAASLCTLLSQFALHCFVIKLRPLQDKQVDPGAAERAKESIGANALWLQQHGQEACGWVAAQLQQGQGGGAGAGRRRAST